MRVRLTDPLEIAKAFIEGKIVYSCPVGGVPYAKSIETVEITIKENQFWVEQKSWIDDLKPILDAKWVTVGGIDGYCKVLHFDPNDKEICIVVFAGWRAKIFSYEEAMEKIKPVEGYSYGGNGNESIGSL